MKNLSRLSVLFLVVCLSFVSCKKNDADNLGGSAFTGLKVYVIDGSGNEVEGALVMLYDSKENRDAEINVINQTTTRSTGYAYFTKIDAITYYVLAKKDNGSGTSQTGRGDTAIPIKSQDETGITVILE